MARCGSSSGSSTTSTSSQNSSPQKPQFQSQSQSVPSLGKSTKRPVSMFRNLINCSGAVDTNDAVFVRLINQDINNSKTYPMNKQKPPNGSQVIISVTCRKERNKQGGAGSAGLFRACMNSSLSPIKSHDKHQKTVSSASACRPISGPRCSHCRKQFKPERLHSHMKSCSGIKAQLRSAATSVVNLP